MAYLGSLAVTRLLYWWLLAIIIVPIFGQLQRLEIGSGAALMLADLLVFLFGITYVLYKIAYDRKFDLTRSGIILLTLWSIMLISLVFGSRDLLLNEMLVSALYFTRFIAYTGLYFIARDVLKEEKYRQGVLRVLLVVSLLLALLGFLQLHFFPDFYALGWYRYGWDPHIGRLTSTWLDPNYIGGYFAAATVIMLAMLVELLKLRHWSKAGYLSLIISLMLIALMLTYSRSSYLALLCGLALLGILRLRKLVLITGLFAVLLFSCSERLQERVLDAYQSFKSLFGQSTYALDDTARLRFQSWERGFSIFADSPLLGVGYNTLKFKNQRAGFGNIDKHASGGFDSSLLTILTTSGLLGLSCFLLFFISICQTLWKMIQKGTLYQQNLALGILGAGCSLLIHSLFVNSLFFPFIMIPALVLLGLIDQKIAMK